jgi:polyhydroxyalkanoate synthase
MLFDDVRSGRQTQCDETALEIGRDIACTAGSVVFRNELVELIQYRPMTSGVARRPLVIVPPCINKYYILDLQPHNSLVRHAIGAGHTVFMLSWRNVGAEQGRLRWDDYLSDGVLSALRAARDIARADRVNTLGFCIGGTLLACALAVLASRGDAIASSLTLLTAPLEFSEPGPLGAFIDEASVGAVESSVGKGGILPARLFAQVFASLRPAELIWPQVVDHYLLGKPPPIFDLLAWNADGTNLPGPMASEYLRTTYLENRLRIPGASTMLGESIDLSRVDLPTYVFAAREDHIVPWRAAYRSARLLGGKARLALGAAGHVAGVVCPPGTARRAFRAGPITDDDADRWASAAPERTGSWWPDWTDWLSPYGGELRRAPP